MYRRSVSGQFLYFPLVSVFSGNIVTSGAGGISGSVSADGGAQAVVAGAISEIGCGQYVLKMYANDTSGNCLGFIFTASGCMPVNFTAITDGNISGRIGIVSGTFIDSYSGQLSLSGVAVNALSGAFTIASLNSGQFTIPYSGSFVDSYSGQLSLSGVPVGLLSGQSTLIYSGQMSGFQMTARTVSDKSGYVIAADGFDYAYAESGLNMRQAAAVAAAAAGGQLSGVGTGTINIDGATRSGATRITATINSSGNRAVVVITPPT